MAGGQLDCTTLKGSSSRREEAHFNYGSLVYPSRVSLLTSAATKGQVDFDEVAVDAEARPL